MHARRGFAVVAAAALVALAVVGAPAFADPPPSFELTWSKGAGAESCIDVPELAGGVAARLGRNPFAANGARTIDGSVGKDGDHWVAHFILHDAAGATLGERTLTSDAADCASLGSAVTLALALAIDPDAVFTTAPSASSKPAPATEVTTAPSSRGAHALPPFLPYVGRHDALPARASLAAVFVDGLVPRPTVGVGLGVDPAHAGYFHARAAAFFAPSTTTADGAASFGVSALALDLCAHDPNETMFGLIACAGVFGGIEHAVAKVGTPVTPGDHGIAGGLLTVGAVAAPFKALVVEASFGLLVPFVRPRYFFEGRADPVFRPTTGLFALLSVGTPL